MDKIKAIIIDDEPKVSKSLEIQLEMHFPEVEIVSIARSVKEGVDMILVYKPDLVFLDIVMPGESGFELFNYFKKIEFEIIFVTSYSEYALNAIKVSALAYLLKPVEINELKEALDLVILRKGQKDAYKNYQVLVENMKKNVPGEQTIAISNHGELVFVKINDILFCEGWDRYTKIHLLNRKEVLSSYSLGKFKSILEPYLFISSHRSFLVNPKHIVSINQNDELHMTNGLAIPISQRKKHEIIEAIKNK
ncbi:MAG: response regulator transcription factor [Saprospiraceae bacterium]|nr:response regulator transcription factor [Saprospiraceae bacterium]